jgi:hypothetical protein
MVVVGGQIDNNVVPFIVSVDGMEAEVRVGLITRSVDRPCRRFDENQTLYLATTPPASLSIT